MAPNSLGSAGTIVSAVLSKGIVLGSLQLKKISGSSAWTTDKQLNYMRDFLNNVLKQDLGWELV